MGFKLPAREYVLLFEDSALEGAEVRLKATTVGTMLRLHADSVTLNDEITALCEHVISWNLETSDGVPIKPIPNEVKEHVETAVLRSILLEWMRAARGITAPLDQPSKDGGSFPVESIPMEVLSSNQTN